MIMTKRCIPSSDVFLYTGNTRFTHNSQQHGGTLLELNSVSAEQEILQLTGDPLDPYWLMKLKECRLQPCFFKLVVRYDEQKENGESCV
jgi:hypothetical protein